ncbi:MAG: hypothetical protein ABI597_03755 [Gammaproteobacteria bacterium]
MDEKIGKENNVTEPKNHPLPALITNFVCILAGYQGNTDSLASYRGNRFTPAALINRPLAKKLKSNKLRKQFELSPFVVLGKKT